ncbi:Gfo/Idh/MocA family protein [Demequina silvatica]|uniref:Gfo/Idh/MocA family protein n=1 Tax=Demequina silvatica TaxID=1638988 RepID=UPI000782CE5B|nr:Gfo/Idh/MocA family oxidoreductase [Demequina silvatica]
MSGSARLRIGVLGAARILDDALLAPVREVADVQVTAIAARDRARAEAVAARAAIGTVLGSYQEVLDSPDVDAVYIPLPAALHGEWTVRAAEAGKHVLCEKPFTSSVTASREVAAAVQGLPVTVTEAYHTGFHPHLTALRGILASGEIGRVVRARATFCVPIPKRSDIRWNAALGGGGLLDVGYYPMRLLRDLLGEVEAVDDARAWLRGDVDRLVEARLAFAGGVEGGIVSSMWSRRLIEAHLRVVGTAGSVDMAWPYHPQMKGRIVVRSGEGRRVEQVTRRTSYVFQLEAFRDATRGGPNPADASAAVAQAEALRSTYSAAGLALG